MTNQKNATFCKGTAIRSGKRPSNSVLELYEWLKTAYGPMGWWPVRCEQAGRGYHPEVFPLPVTRTGAFEVCIGAVLTQNTAWTQVEKALDVLIEQKIVTPEAMLEISEDILAEAIRPAGYRYQKAKYLKALASWFLSRYPTLRQYPVSTEEMRCELLKVRGVGPETADSILLYAFHLPTFVIDTYTRRICVHLGLAELGEPYGVLRSLFMDALPHDPLLFQEFHALLVQHAKLYYSGQRKEGASCPLHARFASSDKNI